MLSAAYFEAVDSKTASGLFIPRLQVADDAVMHILFLLPQEMGRHSVQ